MTGGLSRLAWLGFGLWIVLAGRVEASEQNTAYPIKKVVQYGYTLQNTTSKTIRNAVFRTYAPVRQTATQKLIGLAVSRPYKLEEDAYGNQVLAFELDVMPPNGSRLISITAELAFSETPNKVAVSDSGYTNAERFIEASDNKLQLMAQSLLAGSPRETARNIQNWIGSNIQPEIYVADDRGAIYAMTHRRGDCTEFSYLFAALGRANGIPVRVMGGYVYENNATLKAVDYHNWVEFFTDGVWQLADPHKKNFLAKQSSYVAMRAIPPGGKGLLGDAHRFTVSGEGLRVVMN